ncbi:hypothetical protein MNV49_004331 [Pseudohyphozyma bogoriensis]|nr:hypothetical protein MNV49_004331 [Pseudohyphozyma bogoriensis]
MPPKGSKKAAPAPKVSSSQVPPSSTNAAAPPAPPPFPLAHYLSRAPLQLGAIYFVAVQGANMNSDDKIASLSAAVAVLVEKPVETLLVVCAGFGFVQTVFGLWARSCRNAKTGKVEQKPSAPKKGFMGAWKDMGAKAMAGKAPVWESAKRADDKKAKLELNLGPSVLVTFASALVLHICAVLLGAPLYDNVLETLLLSSVVALLAIAPLAIAVPHTEQYTWLRLFSSLSPKDDLELTLLAPAVGAIVGSWFGAFPIPLDWDQSWQVSAVYLRQD